MSKHTTYNKVFSIYGSGKVFKYSLERGIGLIAPVATAATGIGDTSFTANWNAYAGAFYYLLDVSTSPTFNTFILQDQVVFGISYTVTGLTSNTTYYYRLRALLSGTFDTSYESVLNYANIQGYTTPSYSQQIKQNQLVLDLKAGGIWSKLDTFGVFATDGSSDFALIDWKRLSQYTAVNSPTFTTNQGFQGNATSSYIDTNYKPSTDAINMTLNSSSFNIYTRIDQSGFTVGHGAYLTLSGLYINAVQVGGFRSWNNSNSAGNNGIYSGAPSFYATDRNSNTTITHINNGSQIGSILISSSSLANRNILLLASADNTTTSIGEYNNAQISVVSLGASLNTEKTNYYNAINSYMTSI
jgi:hypothetical protein